MSANPQAIAATLRGKAAVNEVRELLDRLHDIDGSIDLARDVVLPIGSTPFQISADEYHEVLARRRDAVIRKLENKGIRVAPEPSETTAAPPLRGPDSVDPPARD